MNIHNVEFIKSCVAVEGCPTGLPQVAFAGKSNVGKSSVINRVLLRKNYARVGEAPGKTTHINYFNIDEKIFLVDLPGYGYAKVSKAEKARWGILMDQYFGSGLIDYGVMIVDARHKPTKNDMTMADCFKATGRPFVVVANKLDKLKKSQIAGNLQEIRLTLGLTEDIQVIPFSAEKGDGRDELMKFLMTTTK
ncbi:MAG: ribosome biogenesis GTP-binding protein YihA/YsxC [Eubacteriales bacterium]